MAEDPSDVLRALVARFESQAGLQRNRTPPGQRNEHDKHAVLPWHGELVPGAVAIAQEPVGASAPVRLHAGPPVLPLRRVKFDLRDRGRAGEDALAFHPVVDLRGPFFSGQGLLGLQNERKMSART